MPHRKRMYSNATSKPLLPRKHHSTSQLITTPQPPAVAPEAGPLTGRWSRYMSLMESWGAGRSMSGVTARGMPTWGAPLMPSPPALPPRGVCPTDRMAFWSHSAAISTVAMSSSYVVLSNSTPVRCTHAAISSAFSSKPACSWMRTGLDL